MLIWRISHIKRLSLYSPVQSASGIDVARCSQSGSHISFRFIENTSLKPPSHLCINVWTCEVPSISTVCCESFGISKSLRIVEQLHCHAPYAFHFLPNRRELHKICALDGFAQKEYFISSFRFRLVSKGIWHLRMIHQSILVTMDRRMPKQEGIDILITGAGCTLNRNLVYLVSVVRQRALTFPSFMCSASLCNLCSSL